MRASKAHIPVASLLAIAAFAGGAGGALGWLLTRSLGWPEAPNALLPSYLGAGAVVLAGSFAALVMHVYVAGDERRLPNALLAGTGMRMLGVLFLGLFVSLLIQHDRPMWLGLLCAGVLALTLDTLVLLKATGKAGTGSVRTDAQPDAPSVSPASPRENPA